MLKEHAHWRLISHSSAPFAHAYTHTIENLAFGVLVGSPKAHSGVTLSSLPPLARLLMLGFACCPISDVKIVLSLINPNV